MIVAFQKIKQKSYMFDMYNLQKKWFRNKIMDIFFLLSST